MLVFVFVVLVATRITLPAIRFAMVLIATPLVTILTVLPATTVPDGVGEYVHPLHRHLRIIALDQQLTRPRALLSRTILNDER
jgi:hypothetical protein